MPLTRRRNTRGVYSVSHETDLRLRKNGEARKTLAIFSTIAIALFVWQTFRLGGTVHDEPLVHVKNNPSKEKVRPPQPKEKVRPPLALREGPRSRAIEAELLWKHRRKHPSKTVKAKPHWLEQASQVAYPVRKCDTYEQKCPEDEDINHLIRRREERWRAHARSPYRDKHKIWQNAINNKLGGYLFARKMGVRVPRIEFCTGDGPEALADYTAPTNRGFVVKNLYGHSSNSVYVMDTGYGGKNRITDKNMSLEDIQADLKKVNTNDIYIEELIEGGGVKGSPPDDYKFFMFNGVVGSIDVYRNRGTDRHCLASYDEHWNRLDKFGCFLYSKSKKDKKEQDQESCPPVKPSKQGLSGRSFCSDLAPPKGFPQMIETAKRLSKRIGVFMRIDMFEDGDGNAVLGEFTPYSSHGRWSCAAKVTGECIDSCFLGRLWKEMSNITDYEEGRWEKRNGKFVKRQLPIEGGPITPEPNYLKGWENLTTKEKCARIEGL